MGWAGDGQSAQDGRDKPWLRPAKINSERVYGVLADQCPSMELDLNEVSRVSAPRIFEFTIAGLRRLVVAE